MGIDWCNGIVGVGVGAPMSAKSVEAARLVELHRSGDPRALEALVRLTMPWLRHIAQRYVHRGLELEDGIQVACMGLLRALRDYCPSRGSWHTYCMVWARSALDLACTHAGTVRRHRHTRFGPTMFSLDRPVHSDDSGSITHLDCLEAPDRPLRPQVMLEQRLGLLTAQQRLCCELRLEGLDDGEIARRLGISETSVSTSIQRALARLRSVVV